MKNLTTEEFICQAKIIHGNKYDYSKVDYKNNYTKICIVCPEHGEFWQIPKSHLNGCGCNKCRKTAPLNTQDFIKKARHIHGIKYDYSEVEYKGSLAKVCIICPIHGRFYQRPSEHLAGKGCMKCKGRYKGNEEFIKQSIAVHGDIYDYSKTKYLDCYTKVCIICPAHGEFYQIPPNHLQGRGCPYCKESHGERDIAKWLDEHSVKYQRQFKVIPTQVLFGRNRFYTDFYLPDHNTFIEFNGEQHYRRATIWQSEEQFQEQQDRDRRLREYCKQHKIRLIEIPYTEIDNIDNILTQRLLKSNKNN